jgi:dystroglycan 1
MVGKMLWFPIPNDTFYDREDGGTNNLLILLQANDGLELTPMSWIKLNETSKTLFGLPMEENVGRHQYRLAAIDREAKIATSAFEVVVERGPSTARISHEFSVVLDLDFQEFGYKVSNVSASCSIISAVSCDVCRM